MPHKFHGNNFSYVNVGQNSNGRPADLVHGQKDMHRKAMSQNFTTWHIKTRYTDGRVTLNNGDVGPGDGVSFQ